MRNTEDSVENIGTQLNTFPFIYKFEITHLIHLLFFIRYARKSEYLVNVKDSFRYCLVLAMQYK